MAGQPEPLPILIGLSGKRDLRGREDLLRRTLEATFATLDAEFPHAPKVLVTGLAEGADILASELALLRPFWRVAGLLPFALDDYAATMTDHAARERLRACLEQRRVRHRTLAPLTLPPPAERSKEIAGRSETSLHYEQLALWLTEHCTVLLTVLPADETADRPGGTGRVVLHARDGSPDALGRAVIDVSHELARHPVLDPPRPRPVWRIDLAGEPRNGKLPSAIVSPEGGLAEPERLAAQFPLAADIDDYNYRARTDPGAGWPASRPEAANLVRSYRTALSGVQGSFQVYWKRCIWVLAAAFVLAVLLLEAFAKLGHDFPFADAIHLREWAMPAYVAILAGAMGLYLVAVRFRWQSTHEDYRAANEVLRVQHMWWQAGLTGPTHRADYYYLLGAEPPLANLRYWAATVVSWARILATPPEENWRALHATRGSYVEGQRDYFHRRSLQRERAVFIVSVVSWFCFALAFGLSLWLALHGVTGDILGSIARAIGERAGGAPVSGLVTVCVLTVRLLSPTQAYGLPQTAVPGVLLGAFVLSFALYDLGDCLTTNHEIGGKAMVLITTVALLAIAGGVRFVSDKLAWEAEALAYHEAHVRFSHAARLLADIDGTAGSESEKKRQKRVVLYELGLAALAENEAWLRAHRERPIEPVLGA